MFDFRAPKETEFTLRLAKTLFPVYRLFMEDMRVMPAAGAIQRMQAFAGSRMMICPNHSNRYDPQNLFSFSMALGESFRWVAAREVFDWNYGIMGFLLQRVGCYSVVRGAVDRQSFKTTVQTLVDGKRKLVLFPEGEISRQNDTLQELEHGAVRLCFSALEDLERRGVAEPVYLMPMAIKYKFRYDAAPRLINTVARLEEALAMRRGSTTPRQRLRAVADEMLCLLEEQYSIVKPSGSLNDRANLLKRAILDRVAQALDVEVRPGASLLECTWALNNAVGKSIDAIAKSNSPYAKSLLMERAKRARSIQRDISRVVTFLTIDEGYVEENPTQERFADVVGRFEMELFDKRDPSVYGPLDVFVDVSEPINLRDYLGAYRKDKRGTVATVTNELESRMLSTLRNLCKVGTYRTMR